MYIRVLVEAVVLAPPLAGALAPWMLGSYALVEGVALAITTALAFGALYAGVAFVATAAIALVSAESLSLVGAVTGLNDVDAMTLSMGNLVQAGLAVGPAAKAVLAAVTVNAAVKAGLALTLGGKVHVRRVVPVLAIAVVFTATAWALV
jgi:uncharacterized membrane protein (DUF4010 family)